MKLRNLHSDDEETEKKENYRQLQQRSQGLIERYGPRNGIIEITRLALEYGVDPVEFLEYEDLVIENGWQEDN